MYYKELHMNTGELILVADGVEVEFGCNNLCYFGNVFVDSNKLWGQISKDHPNSTWDVRLEDEVVEGFSSAVEAIYQLLEMELGDEQG